MVLPNALIEDVATLNPGEVSALATLPYFGAKRLALYGAEVLAAMKQHR